MNIYNWKPMHLCLISARTCDYLIMYSLSTIHPLSHSSLFLSQWSVGNGKSGQLQSRQTRARGLSSCARARIQEMSRRNREFEGAQATQHCVSSPNWMRVRFFFLGILPCEGGLTLFEPTNNIPLYSRHTCIRV